MPTRFFRTQDLQVAVDLAPQVLRLEMDPFASWGEMVQHARRRPSEAGIATLEFDRNARFQGPLYPSIAALPEGRPEPPLVSAAALAQKAKAVDDGIVAALEILLDEGAGDLRGRAPLLRGWQDMLREEWDRSPEDTDRAEAIGLLAAARSLAGDDDADLATWPPSLRLRRSRRLHASRMNPEHDVPLGLYSWDRRLAGLYRQAKALQQPLQADVAAALARCLRSDGAMRAAYERHLALSALTNPLVRPDLLSDAGAFAGDDPRPAVFPASDSPEGRLVKRLIGNRTVPPGFDLTGELIARVADGRLNLAPAAEGGWYDHVLYALEPLLRPDEVPEVARLRLAPNYRDDLKELFRSLLAATRETHVKQIEVAMVGCALPEVIISPQLTFEPLAEHYRRRAASYRFVRERLVGLIGEDVLLSRNRVTPSGEIGGRLLDELILMEQLYTGAWAVVLDELGMAPEPGQDEGLDLKTARAAARTWASSQRGDPDLREDVRMMVPLFKDIERDEFHVLAVVGIEQRRLSVHFDEPPQVTVRDGQGRLVEPEIVWSSTTYPLARPVTIACRTKRLLDRDQFRALCDRAGSVDEIRSAIED